MKNIFWTESQKENIVCCSCSTMPAWLKCGSGAPTIVQCPWGLKLGPDPLEDLEMESNISLSCIHWFHVNVMPFYKWLPHKNLFSDVSNMSRTNRRILISLIFQKSTKIHHGSFYKPRMLCKHSCKCVCCIHVFIRFSWLCKI